MKDKKICIIAPVHGYRDIRVFQKQAISLSKDFKSVTLYARADKDKIEDGISIKNVPTFDLRLFRFLYLFILFFRVIFNRSDLYILHNPDTIPLLFGLKLFGRKVVYDTHEDFSKRILMRSWLPNILRPTLAKLIEQSEKLAYSVSNAFIVTQSTLVDKYGIESFLVENAPIVSDQLMNEVANSKVEKRILNEKPSDFQLVYVGGISIERGIFDILEGLIVINQTFDCKLILVGPVSDELLIEMQEHHAWKYVSYKGVLSQHDAFAWMKHCDVGLIWLRDVGDYSETSPNKLFEYGAMGIPFIATNFKLWRTRFSKYRSGIFIEPESISDFVKGVKYLYNNPVERNEMGLNGNAFVIGNYNWSLEYPKFKLAIDKALR